MRSILHVITGLEDGGAEAALFRLSTNDKNSRHHVVSLMGEGIYGPRLRARGVDVVSLNMRRGRVSLLGLLKLWRLMRTSEPDVVQTWMYHADLVGGAIARIAGIRNVAWGIRHTDLVEGESTGRTIKIARICAKLSRVIPRIIVCCAERGRSVHAELGYDEGRMVVIPNGYDLSVFAPDLSARVRVRHQLGLTASDAVLGFVARYNPQKDHRNLLQALAKLQTEGLKPICLLVGAGMDDQNFELKGRITELGLDQDSVKLLGRSDDVPAIMNALDIHVMSSSFGEAFPNVLAEAMACGTPCISTDVGDAREIVGDTGQIVPPNDANALAAAIAEMLPQVNGIGWNLRGEAARKHVCRNFSMLRMIDGYHRAWAEG